MIELLELLVALLFQHDIDGVFVDSLCRLLSIHGAFDGFEY